MAKRRKKPGIIGAEAQAGVLDEIEVETSLPPKMSLPGIGGIDMSADDVFDRKVPTSFVQPICLDGDLADARDETRMKVLELERLIQIARITGPASVDPGLAAELAVAQRKAAEAAEAAAPVTALFRMLSIGRPAYAKLLRRHPPTAEQRATFRQLAKDRGVQETVPPYNDATFPPALVAASCASPKLTEEEAGWIWNGREEELDADGEVVVEAMPAWSEGECGALFEAALAANRIVR